MHHHSTLIERATEFMNTPRKWVQGAQIVEHRLWQRQNPPQVCLLGGFGLAAGGSARHETPYDNLDYHTKKEVKQVLRLVRKSIRKNYFWLWVWSGLLSTIMFGALRARIFLFNDSNWTTHHHIMTVLQTAKELAMKKESKEVAKALAKQQHIEQRRHEAETFQGNSVDLALKMIKENDASNGTDHSSDLEERDLV